MVLSFVWKGGRGIFCVFRNEKWNGVTRLRSMCWIVLLVASLWKAHFSTPLPRDAGHYLDCKACRTATGCQPESQDTTTRRETLLSSPRPLVNQPSNEYRTFAHLARCGHCTLGHNHAIAWFKIIQKLY
jgi:hypothetical protein